MLALFTISGFGGDALASLVNLDLSIVLGVLVFLELALLLVTFAHDLVPEFARRSPRASAGQAFASLTPANASHGNLR